MANLPSPDIPQDGSLFKIYSLGIVANNRSMSNYKIQVTPIEALTMIDGELGSVPTDQETQGQDADGNSYTSKVKADTAIEADWFPGIGASNRRTPPDVRRGERVLIYQYADTDQYYWTTSGLDDHLRKLETVVYSWSGSSDEAVDGTKDGSCYSLEVSTHTGQITLKTSKANGEHCMYAIQVNAKEGKIMIVDDVDNEIVFDSKNTHIWAKNADGTIVELDKKVAHIFAPDAINMEATNSMTFKTKNFLIQCTDYKLVSQTFRTECSTGSFKGQYTFEDPVTFNQTVAATGMITATGGLESPVVPIHGPSDTLN